MKNTLGFAAILIFSLSAYLLLTKNTVNLPKKTEVLPVKINSFVNEYNAKISQIESLTADIETNTAAKAKLTYDKKNNQFHFEAFSTLGKEMDVGTNKDFFWVWSRRFDSKLYYAKKANIEKCNLKPQFDPSFLIKIIGLEPIQQVINTKDGAMAFEELNKKVYVCYMDHNNSPKKHLLYHNNQILVLVEIKESQEINGIILPKIVELTMAEEKTTISWTFKNIKINTLKDYTLSVPEIQPKILIGSQ